MPFELGLYLGARRFGNVRQRRKNCLILDKTRFRYQRFLSDIAGQDIAEHRNSPRKAVQCIRNWLVTVSRRDDIPGAAHIWSRYQAFQSELPQLAADFNLRPDELQFIDLCRLVARWLQRFATAV